MATANELLASLTGSEEKVCVIDNDLRTIKIPKTITALGVEADDDVHRLKFQMPRMYGDTDLSVFNIRINYLNASNEGDIYVVADKTVKSSVITFSWLVGPHALAYKGDVKFIVCLKESDAEGNILREFNTTIATLPVLEGLEVDAAPLEGELQDVLEQLQTLTATKVAEVEAVGLEQVQKVQEKSKEEQDNIRETADYIRSTFGDDYETTVKLQRTRANAIVGTVEGESIAVNDASDDYLRGLRVFGKSTQVTTTGKNLVDLPQHIAKPSSAYNYDLFTGTSGQSTAVSSEYLNNLPYLQPGTYYFHVTVPDEYVSAGTKVLAVTDDGAIDNLLLNECGSFTLTAPTRVTIRIGSNAAFSVDDVQIESGSVYTGYESYSGGYASPSPNWPQPIDSVEQAAIHICGKNLFNMNAIDETSSVTRNPDGSLNVTLYYNGTQHYLKDLAPGLIVGKKYVLHLDTDGSKFIYLSKYGGVWDHGYTFTITQDMLDSSVAIYGTIDQTAEAPTTTKTIRSIQIALAGESNEYEPYRETQSVTLDHSFYGIPVDSGGNYTDENGQQWICDEIDFERGVYVQRIGRFELNGAAKWVEYASDPTSNLSYRGFMIWNMLDETCSRPNGFCNQFQTVGAGTDNCVWVGANGDYCVYVVSKEWYNKGIDAWKTHLNENPLEVIYTRVAPIYHDLSEAELAAYSALHSNYPTTTVMNDQGAHMELKYNADTQTVFENSFRPTDAQVQAAVDAWLTAHFSSAEGVKF